MHASENVARAFRQGKYRSRDAREHRRQRDSFQRDDDNFVQCGCQQWAMLASRCSTGAANFVTAIVAVRLLVTNPSDRDAEILTDAFKLLGTAYTVAFIAIIIAVSIAIASPLFLDAFRIVAHKG